MRITMVRVFTAVALAFVISSSASCTTYSARVLNPPAGAILCFDALNDNGEAAACVEEADGYRLFLWNVMTGASSTGALVGSVQPRPIDLNNCGQVAGVVGFTGMSFIWSEAAGIVLLDESSGRKSGPSALNNVGQVVGRFTTGGTTAFCWTESTGMVDIGTLGGPSSRPDDVNDSGQAVGYSTTSDGRQAAFIWTESDGMIEIPGLGNGSYAYAINNLGQVVGVTDILERFKTVFLWSESEGVSTIATFECGLDILPRAINDAGVVVGSCPEGAFAWSAADGFQILGPGHAYDINNVGQIIGGDYSHNIVLWEPIPEPSSLLALFAAFAGLGVMRRRK